jgi:hypothetical protein
MQALSFRDFIHPAWIDALYEQQFAAVSGLPSIGGSMQANWETGSSQGKPWKAHRKDVVDFWQKLKPNLPLKLHPIDPHHKGTRFHEDGLRITGSPEFINSILSRIKDFLGYESNPGTKLDVEYRQIETKEGDLYNKPVYVCYVHVLTNTGKKEFEKFSKPKEIKLAEPMV